MTRSSTGTPLTVVRAGSSEPNAAETRSGVSVRLEFDHVDEVIEGPDGAALTVSSPDDVPPASLHTADEFGGPGGPEHLVVEGENLVALRALRDEFAGRVDVVCIDPPYNTGAQRTYRDRFGTRADPHVAWLSFMQRRLEAMLPLLGPTSLVASFIGEDEHHHLRMLLDQTLGSGNFCADITWQGRIKNDRRFTGGGVDHLLVYARDRARLVADDVFWSEPRPGATEMLELVRTEHRSALEEGLSAERAAARAQTTLRRWIRENLDWVGRSLGHYNSVTPEGRIFLRGPLDWPGGDGPRYLVLHPVTGRPVPIPKRGWGVVEETFAALDAQGLIVWGPDETTPPKRRVFLDQRRGIAPLPTFTRDRLHASRHLDDLLGEHRFDHPKDHEVLMRWLAMWCPDDGVVLDFFGGSGSTTEAVLRLNAADGGRRRSILVTSNEVGPTIARKLRSAGVVEHDPQWEAAGVFRRVTEPRIRAVVTGTRPDGSVHGPPCPARVRFCTVVPEKTDGAQSG